MRATNGLSLVLALVLPGGCTDLDVPDLNSPGLEEFQTNPTRSALLSATSGLLIGTRVGIDPQNGYVALLGILGREAYNFDPADPRFVTEMLLGPLDGGSPAFGGNLWANPYRSIRNANLVLAGVDKVTLMSAAEKEGVRGFAKTIQALDYLNVVNTRDANGAPIPTDLDPLAPPAPIMSRDQVIDQIVSLLDAAQTHLQAAGSTFPFALSPGFAGFNTPTTFLRFNRALMARVQVYRGSLGCASCWDAALTALSASFIDPAGDLRLGVYHSYSTLSGDETNSLFDPDARALLAHPSLEADAQLQAGGMRDDRFVRKIVRLATPKTAQGLSSALRFAIYNSTTDPIPIIRNEELILLRAEANIGKGGAADLTAAVTDINTIRSRSGALPAYAGAVTQAALLDELLYNRRYSLMFEGGHRWIDVRRYGRLTTLPQDATSGGPAKRFSKFPISAFECDARTPAPPGCAAEVGS